MQWLDTVLCPELAELGQMSPRDPVRKTRELLTDQPVQGRGLQTGVHPVPAGASPCYQGKPGSGQFDARGWEGTEAAGLFLTQCSGSWEQLGFLLFKELNCWNLTHPLIMLPKTVLNVDQGSFSWCREMGGCGERTRRKELIF